MSSVLFSSLVARLIHSFSFVVLKAVVSFSGSELYCIDVVTAVY